MSKLGIFGAVTVTAIGSALAALNFGPTPAADQVIVGLQSDQGGGVAGGGSAELGASGSATSARVDGDTTGRISATDKDDKAPVVWSYDHTGGTGDSDGDTSGTRSGSGSGSSTHGDTTGSATWSYDYTYEHDATTGTSSGSGSATIEKSPGDTTTDDTTTGNKSDDGHKYQGEGNLTWDHDSDGGSVTWQWGDKSGTVTWDTSGWDSKDWDKTDWGWDSHDH